jgi:dTDP-4-amino-4,6-dideoxygalactose transaminase
VSTSEAVPLVDLRAAHAEVADEIGAGLSRLFSAAAFIKGADVTAFEREYAAFSGVAHCIGVANGTDAVELALRAAGVGQGAPVILPVNTFTATAGAVVRAGARPVFADVDARHLLLDPAALGTLALPGTAAVIPVHLYGQMAPMREIADIAAHYGAAVIEDAAQAHGATQDGQPVGASVAAMAATSFYPSKNLGAYGDAGAVLTGSAPLMRRLRLLSDHGAECKHQHLIVGFNSRLDTLQAMVLRAKLRHLAQWNHQRRLAAARYAELLGDLEQVVLPTEAPGNRHVWHLFVVRVPRREQVLAALRGSGIGAAVHYPVPLHLEPAFRYLGYRPGDFPVAEAAAQSIISLPIFPQITADQQERVADAIRAAVRRPRAAATPPS